LARTSVSRLDEITGDVDTQHVRPPTRRGQRRGAVSTAEIEHLEPRLHTEAFDDRIAALAHALGDAREVALLPECLVRIHASAPSSGPVWLALPDSASHRTLIQPGVTHPRFPCWPIVRIAIIDWAFSSSEAAARACSVGIDSAIRGRGSPMQCDAC